MTGTFAVLAQARPEIANIGNAVDFELSDAQEWARYAVKTEHWQVACSIGKVSSISEFVEAAVTIASPDGRAALWYGRVYIPTPTRAAGRSHRRREVTCQIATEATTRSYAASRYFDERCRRGGERDIAPLALAACRILHANVFGDPVSPRDQLLTEFAVLDGEERPDTPHILKANDTTLEAASALLTLKHYAAARALLAGKGVRASCS